jgi:hypothetical protein
MLLLRWCSAHKSWTLRSGARCWGKEPLAAAADGAAVLLIRNSGRMVQVLGHQLPREPPQPARAILRRLARGLRQKFVAQHNHRVRNGYDKRWRGAAGRGWIRAARGLDGHDPCQVAGWQRNLACGECLAAEYGFDPQRSIRHVDPFHGAWGRGAWGRVPCGVSGSKCVSILHPRSDARRSDVLLKGRCAADHPCWHAGGAGGSCVLYTPLLEQTRAATA